MPDRCWYLVLEERVDLELDAVGHDLARRREVVDDDARLGRRRLRTRCVEHDVERRLDAGRRQRYRALGDGVRLAVDLCVHREHNMTSYGARACYEVMYFA